MISVIIPTYKEPEYLDLCLKSIFEGQTNKNEIIVVVDGFLELNKPILDKYPDVKVLDLGSNQGLAVATNWGVYNATSKYILVVNDDNVFPLKWDVVLELYASDWKKGFVLSPNQIEPNPSMFKQFIIENLGKSPEEFDLEKFQKWEIQNKRYEHDYSGSTLPFFMNKYDFLAVGGWDVMYPSPHVVDWDFFTKCEYMGFSMIRTYVTQFYHFAGAATRKTPEQSEQSTLKEKEAHLFFENKWGQIAQHNPENNSKSLNIYK